MTTELVELADRLDAECSRRIMQSNPSSGDYYDPADPRRILMTEAATAIRALASRAGGWRPIDSAPMPDLWLQYVLTINQIGGIEITEARRLAKVNSMSISEGEPCWYVYWQPLPEPPAAPEPVAEGSALAPGCGDGVG